MKIKLLFLPVLLATGLYAGAKGSISGSIINKSTGEPMDFVNIQLVDAKSGKPLAIGNSTDEIGNFVLPDVADGEYIVKITNIGSISQERPVTVKGDDITIGPIHLADDAKLLQEVVVEGVKSQMKFELDKKVFSVDQDIASTGLSASEVLESIPSVEVDQDGEVSLRGNSSVTVWINGKESGLSADNRAQILEQIPGETIEKIEVITNPSAKYSPEGTAGIINIILKKDVRAGYYGSAEIGANTRGGGNANININYNSSKWDLYASLGFRMRHNRGGSRMRRSFTEVRDENGSLISPEYFLNSDAINNNHGNNLFLRAGATYRLSDKDEFYLNGFGMFGHRWSNSTTLYQTNQPSQGWVENNMFTKNKGDNRGAHGELGYKHTWGDNHTLEIMGSYNYWGGPNDRWYHEQHRFLVYDDEGNPEYDDEGNPVYAPDEDNFNLQKQTINVQSEEVKVDYVQQILPWLKLETGFNGNYGYERTPVTTYQSGLSFSDMGLAKNLYNNFLYRNNVSALYVTLGGKVHNFSFSAGVRGEAWQTHFKSLKWEDEAETPQSKNDIPWTSRNFFSLFPSAFLSYSLPYDNEIQINYTRRLRRPWGGQLNSFIDISDPTNISFGNPELEPEYTNSFELNYIKSWTMHMISLSAYLRTGNNKMERISYLDNDVMYSTFYNVGKETNSGVEIVVKDSFWRGKIDLTTTVNLYNNHLSAWETTFVSPLEPTKSYLISGKKQNAFAWDARMMFSIKLPWSLSFQATGRYASKQLTAQGSRQPGWSVDAGIRKTLGNWSFSISGRDLFDSRKFKNIVYGDGYTQTTERWRGGRRIQFTVKYSFGNMRKQNQQRRQDSEPMDNSGYGDMDF